MAQTKFKLNIEEDKNNNDVTHAHAQKIQKEKVRQPIRREQSNGFFSKLSSPISSSMNLSVHLIKLFEIMTPVQKQQLVDFATKDDKTAACVIKEVLIEQGVIEDDS